MRNRFSSLVLAASVLLGCGEKGPDVTPATIVISPAAINSLVSGSTLTLTAAIANAAGEVLPDKVIEWSSSDANVATVSSIGLVRGFKVGETRIVATVGTLRSAAITVTVAPGPAAQLVVRTQPTGAVSGKALTTQPVVEVRDAAGNLVTTSTLNVTTTIGSGGGTLVGETAATVDGVATFTAVSISGLVGNRTLIFTAPDLSAVESAGFALAPGPGVQLVLQVEPSGAVVGAPLAVQPVVEIRDEAGNVATSTPATVTASLGAADGTLTSSTATAINGVATFTGLSIVGTVGTRALTFTASGLTTVVSATFPLNIGPPSVLKIRTQPGSGVVSQLLSVQPVLEICDVGNNIVTSPSFRVTATLDGAASLLTGTTSVQSTNGIVTFASLMITSVGTYTLSFAAPGLTPAKSVTFTVVASPPVRVVIIVQPGGAVVGTPLASQPTVGIADGTGTLSGGYSGSVTATVNGFATASNASAVVTDGIAIFSGLTISGTPGTISLTFRAGTLTPATSAPFTLQDVPGTGLHLVVTVSPPQSAPNGLPMNPQPVVEIRDANNIRVSSGVVVTVVTDATSGSIVNGSVAAVNGVATFTGLALSGPGGGRNYFFSAPGMPSVGPFRINIP
jgi:hypothetical protein